ncbi:MAG TPA: phosphate signaling complex protein PhoU [Methanothrix sp.]|nr:phosphate signaling complex protein PhoU [Methanothrix sp.]HOK57826.1 phosphate signaling complex protein PhoU [Methanothrix sp.]HOL43180.1 phosphate signaling complex protein PhoU [Methanothrix sp.]HPO88280.1 phosphate signaling complex protein PhoU [Methanothrix sp.]
MGVLSPYRERYHRDLNALRAMTRELSDLVSSSIERSVEALCRNDALLAREVVQGDYAVDDLSVKLESKCMELLALQQPMAKDLRMIIGILKIGIDLERAGDLAVDIAMAVIQTKDRDHIEKPDGLSRMARIAVEMISGAMEALERGDPEMARNVTRHDYEIDSLYVKVRDALMRMTAENMSLMDQTIPMLMVNRHLERIGDHICNICESIVYMIEGKREHLN